MRYEYSLKATEGSDLIAQSAATSSLLIILRDPVAQSPFDMQGRVVVFATSGPAILKIEIDVGCPCGVVVLLVKMDDIAVSHEVAFFGIFCNHPTVVGVGVVVTQLGAVHENGKLVPATTFFHLGLYLEKTAAVIGADDIICIEFDGVGLASVDGVFQVSASLDFPTVVDL